MAAWTLLITSPPADPGETAGQVCLYTECQVGWARRSRSGPERRSVRGARRPARDRAARHARRRGGLAGGHARLEPRADPRPPARARTDVASRSGPRERPLAGD